MTLRKNIIFNFALTASTVIFPLITFPYITRTLSSFNIGKIFFIDAFTSYFIIFSSIGIPYYGIREVAKLRDSLQKTSNLVVELVVIQFSLALLFSAIFILLYFLLPTLKGDLVLIKIACISIISNAFMIEWFYQGIENFSYITIRSLIVKVLSVTAILVLVQSSSDYVIYYLILAVLALLNAGVNFFNFFKKFYVNFTGKLFNITHFKPLLVLFSINVSISVYTIMDTILLGSFTDPQNVSFYNVPLKLVKMFWMVVGGVGAVLIPRISVLIEKKQEQDIRNLMTKSLNIVFLLTIPFCFFCLFFPTEILSILSGEKYLFAANALRTLSIVPLIIGVCNVMGTQYLLPLGQEKKILHATIVGLIFSLLLNIVLIPYLKFMGSAVACVVAELSVCIYITVSALKHIKPRVDYYLIIQILLCVLFCVTTSRVMRHYFPKSILFLAANGFNYLLCFAVLQIFLFKNQFINSFFLGISFLKRKNI